MFVSLTRRCRGLGFSIVTAAPLVACASAPPPAPGPAPEPMAAAPAAASTPVEAAPTSEEPTPPVSTSTSVEPAPPAPPSFVQLCNQMCDRVAKRCSETATESCRMNCTQYEHPPAGCDAQVRVALECGAKAEDLTCVNIAPESCAPDFRRVVACASGKPEGELPADPTKMPEDWQKFESPTGGFSAPMPRGVIEKGGAPPTFSARSGPAEYEVRILDAPPEKTQKALVRVTIALVGKCGRKLKLFGMVEKPERVTVRYESRCPNGDERHGQLVIAGTKMYVLEIRAPQGVNTPKDPFFYAFELRGSP